VTAPALATHAAAVPVPDARRRGVLPVAVLLVVVTVGWRRGEYFTGSLDPVVVAKAALSALALAFAFLMATSAPRRRVGTAWLWWLGVVLGCSSFGALSAGLLVPGGAVAARVAMLAAIVHLLLRAAPGVQVVTSLAVACGGVAAVAAVTGLPTPADGRLAGGVPALSPNEMSLLAGVVVLVLVWRGVLGLAGWPAAVGAAGFLGVIWATESRTGLLMVLVGAAVMVVHVRRPRVGPVVGALVLGALGVVAAAATGAITSFAARGGDGTSTLESRFIAWRAAVHLTGSGWQQAFGSGLALKIIPIKGEWWDEQPLDSSWVSLLVQAGVLGLAVAVGWVLWTLRGAARAPRPVRVLFLGLLVFLVGRSTVESGMFDATPAFLLLAVVSALTERGSAGRLAAEAETLPD
jgi:O-antigen ligase